MCLRSTLCCTPSLSEVDVAALPMAVGPLHWEEREEERERGENEEGYVRSHIVMHEVSVSLHVERCFYFI